MWCRAVNRVVLDTCVDCWAAELAFRGAPKDAVEYIDIRFVLSMVEVQSLPLALKPVSKCGLPKCEADYRYTSMILKYALCQKSFPRRV